jgi:hypothetical protein
MVDASSPQRCNSFRCAACELVKMMMMYFVYVCMFIYNFIYKLC